MYGLTVRYKENRRADMFPVLGMLRAASHSIVDRANGFVEFIVVPELASAKLLREFDIDPAKVECHFCHESLVDLKQVRAIYNLGGKFVAACDKFECAIKARNRAIE